MKWYRSFQNFSIRKKLILAIVSISGFGLFVSAGTFFWYDADLPGPTCNMRSQPLRTWSQHIVPPPSHFQTPGQRQRRFRHCEWTSESWEQSFRILPVRRWRGMATRFCLRRPLAHQ